MDIRLQAGFVREGNCVQHGVRPLLIAMSLALSLPALARPAVAASQRAGGSLSSISEDELVGMFFRRTDVSQRLVEEELLRRGPAAVPPLIESLVSRGTSGPVPELLAKLHVYSAEPLVEALFAAEDFETRQSIRLVLFDIKEDEVSVLAAALDRADAASLKVLADVFRETGKVACMHSDALGRALETPDAESRADFLAALEQCGPRAVPAIEAMIRLLERGDEDTIRMTAGAIGEIGPAAKGALPALRSALEANRRRPRMRSDIEWAIEQVESGESLTIAEFDRMVAVEKRSREIKDRHDANVRSAGYTLESALAGFTIADAALWEWLSNDLARRENLQSLEKALSSSDPRIRLGAATAMFRMRTNEERVAGIMIAGLGSSDPVVLVGILETFWSGRTHMASPAVPRLVELVGATRDEDVRDVARRLVLSIRPSHPVALPLLEDALSAADDWDRSVACMTIASLGTAGLPLCEEIRSLAADESEDVRRNAARALVELARRTQDARAARAAADVLRTADEETRYAAFYALFQDDSGALPPEIESVLVRSIDDPSDRIAGIAFSALARGNLTTNAAAQAAWRAYVSDRGLHRKGAGEVLLRAKRLDLFARALLMPDMALRADAAVRLSRGLSWQARGGHELKGAGLEEKAVVDAVRPLLDHADPYVREASLRLVGHAGVVEASLVDEICALLGDENEQVRSAASGTLARLGRLAAPYASRHLESRNEKVRLGILESLGPLRTIDLVSVYRMSKRLGDDSIEVALAAVAAMRAQRPDSARFIAMSLSDERPRARRLAALASRDWRGQNPQFIAALIGGLSDHDAEVRRAAAVALGSFDLEGEKARNALLAGLSDGDRQVRIAAGRALRRLDAFAYDSLVDALRNEETCEGAAETIGSFYGRAGRTRDALQRALKDARPEDAGALETAIWRSGLDVRYLLEVHPPVFRTWNAPVAVGSWAVEAEIVVLDDGSVDLVRLVRGDADAINVAVQSSLVGARFEPAQDSAGRPVPVFLEVLVRPGADGPAFGGRR